MAFMAMTVRGRVGLALAVAATLGLAATACDGPSCCPIASVPTCDCFATGGSQKLRTCGTICDAAPSAANVQRKVDEDGCPYWEVGGASCLAPW